MYLQKVKSQKTLLATCQPLTKKEGLESGARGSGQLPTDPQHCFPEHYCKRCNDYKKPKEVFGLVSFRTSPVSLLKYYTYNRYCTLFCCSNMNVYKWVL
jgi:hypothetical protein